MRKVLARLCMATTAATLAAAPAAAHAGGASAPCGDVTVVFARGSGQSLTDTTVQRFFGQLDERIDEKVAVNYYELGSESYGGKKYPAVPVGHESWEKIRNSLEADASWTGGLGGNYRASVSDGVTEAVSFLQERAARCGSEQFVLGGYSQGAQVIGNALPALDRSLRDQVAYVALFGDPKLYLPEGRGLFPPACRGKELSPWRRGNVGCLTDGGSLEARVPYVPDDLSSRVGSWCDRDDFVCNNNITDLLHSTHSNYANEGNGVDQAAKEIAESLARRIPAHASSFDTSIFVIGVGTTGLDVAFIIDTTGSMSDDIEAARASARELATAITALRGRVALTEYRDAGDSVVAAVRSPLSSDIADFETALAPLSAGGGGDEPEALLTALMTTFDTLSWRPGATKAAIVLTDASYHDPDVANGWTTAQVAARSLEIDPVNVYAVVPGGLTTTYQDLVDQTSGKVVENTGDTKTALLQAITQIRARPTALFSIDEYWAAPGTPVQFDASPSYDPDSEIVKYEWDFDSDGVFDETTTVPTATHTFSAVLDGKAQVRVTSRDGGVANATADLHINPTGPGGAAPAAPRSLTATATAVDPSTRTVKLDWAAGGGTVDFWRVHDQNGEVIGLVSPARHTVDVTGVPNTAVTLSVAASNAYGTSDHASVVIPALEAAPSSSSARSSSAAQSPSNTASSDPGTGTTVRTGKNGGGGRLSTTGTNVRLIGYLGVALVCAGAVLLLATRRRRRSTKS